ncbi:MULTISPECIES: diacylglycerol kinase family protein [unclassified Rathayibacter]|uniref:diacylglycerol kinase family protein n=1 Tax=unclassified Rathayibacter TaxID=2609250 RepID=UPI00104F14FF|nr:MULTISPECIES: diacylglycerol kinase family protein [unclassified Rathayibacter]TCL83095.1 diacylglycerol kinase family enzyme [Rathayibacter sp. PhB192]TCM28593.1 diacylglycerol kinase family enzyme [Rathayibacter sp. PhB179]
MTAKPPALLPDEFTEVTTSRARRTTELVVFLGALALYSGWTFGVVNGSGDSLDSLLRTPSLPPRSAAGQSVEAFALLTHPYVVLVVTVLAALRSLRQRQRRLALALTIAALGLVFWELQRNLIGRPHPFSEYHDSVSALGAAYPSGHIVGATVLTWVVVTLANARRRSRRAQRERRLLGMLFVALVGTSMWAMGTDRLTDLIGGLLLGTSIATGALWISGVEAIGRAWRLRELPPESGGRAAVIFNPTKVLDLDLFRRRVIFALARSGWDPPLWIETRQDDPGRAMAEYALSQNVDRVLVAGGDGTARTVCAAIAGSGVPVALIPAGTGNLLGRNLGISLDEDEALDVALHGRVREIDMVHWSVDGVDAPFAVMAGVGLDAQIMRDTDARLKKVIKAGAYVVAAVQQRRMRPFRATVTIDGEQIHDSDAVMVLVGNVGHLQGGLALLPAAEPDDGLLHVLVASGEGGLRGLLRLVLSITRKDSPDAPLRRLRGRQVDIELDRPMAYQLDGDTEGLASTFSARVDPGALLVMTPH